MKSTHRSQDLVRRIRRAGGVVTLTTKGHLKVVGPKGIAIIQPDQATDRHWQNTIATLRKYAGIDLKGDQ